MLEFFKTPTLIESKPEFVKHLNKASNKYINEARKKEKEYIKKYDDFGKSYHSTALTRDEDFAPFRDYVGQKSWQFLNDMGYDMSLYTTIFTEMWVQEFAKKGGGHHAAHVHWNQHVSGFYFLKCSENTSYPIFHDPRNGARMTKLKLKPQLNESIEYGSEHVRFKVEPGMLIIFPGYVEHEFVVDQGIDPFRFVHFTIQAIPKEVCKL